MELGGEKISENGDCYGPTENDREKSFITKYRNLFHTFLKAKIFFENLKFRT